METTEPRAVAALKQAEIELARLRVIEREHSQLIKSLHRHALEHCADYPKIEQANEFEQLYALVAVCEGRLCATEDLHAILKSVRELAESYRHLDPVGHGLSNAVIALLDKELK